MTDIVEQYLDLFDLQRESAFAALDGLTEAQIWQRPAPKEWCLGEILDHNYLVFCTFFPFVKVAWKTQQRRAKRLSHRPYATECEDPYRKSTFPMWVGFLWTPRFTPRHPVPLEKLKEENRALHCNVRGFYTGKDPAQLGNATVYDPVIGSLNLIVTLRIGIYHDQLHFDDVFKMVNAMKQ